MTEPTTTSTPATTPTPSTTSTPAESTDAAEPVATAASNCRRLTDFVGTDADAWAVVNDGVMGGRSNGVIEIGDSTLRFTGSVVTAGGGFTSVRLRLDGDELLDTSRIEMRVRPDGRTYGLTMEDAAEARGRSVSHRADLGTGPIGDDGWAIAAVDYDQLVPSLFGQPVDAPAFDPASAREFGIIIADGTDGDFALEIDWIDACP